MEGRGSENKGDRKQEPIKSTGMMGAQAGRGGVPDGGRKRDPDVA